MERNAPQIDRMYADVEWALAQGLPLGELLPMVERLLREAEPGSLHEMYAKRQIAELVVRKEPFRAARLAKDLIQEHPEDDRAHAVLGLACLLMGHFKKAERCYQTALSLMPHCPWYAHNLGHLLDVALGRPGEALPWLRMARRGLPAEPEIASSLAHALLHDGQSDAAYTELLEAVGDNQKRATEILEGWSKER